MIRLLSFWLAGCLLLPSCWGNGGNNSHEEKYDFSIQTPTPEYDYNATFDYVFYTINGQEWDYELNSTDIFNKASGIGPLSLIVLMGLAFHHM